MARKVKVLRATYQGWATDEDGYERCWVKGEVVRVTDEIADYLLSTHPDWFVEVKPKRVKPAVEPEPKAAKPKGK